MAGQGISETISRIDRWCQQTSRIREKALEALLLLDLFRESLGYSKDSAVSQAKVGKMRPGVADIALKVNKRKPTQWVVVEVKRPGTAVSESAITQAAKYICGLRARRGIVTNGNEWVFISVKKKPNAKKIFYATILLQLSLDGPKSKERKALESSIARLGPGTIHGFFEMLESMFSLGRKTLANICYNETPKDLPESISGLIATSLTSKIVAKDLSVIKTICQEPGLFANSILDKHAALAVTKKH
jgi:hypothetical protein